MSRSLNSGPPDTLVLDDNPLFVKLVVENLQNKGVRATGLDRFADFVRAIRSGALGDVELIFLDMRLGPDEKGVEKSAADAILYATTYLPAAKVLIFTHQGIALNDCIRCVELGALGIVPKSSDPDDVILAAKIYRHVGQLAKAREGVINTLCKKLEDASDREKGGYLEMLMTNLLASVAGFTVIQNNKNGVAGEIDLIIENGIDERFWHELQSYHLVIECRNRRAPAEIKDFSALMAKVKAKGSCAVGIMVSMAGVSGGFRDSQQTVRQDGQIFYLDRDHIAAMISQDPDGREQYLRGVLSKQL